jgi:phospholipid transport system substrate-binding protein
MKRILLTALLIASFVAPALADGPMAEIKVTTDKVLALVSDPKVQGDAKKNERRQMVRNAMEKRFAWDESARACLGRHWLQRTPAEKAEFIQLFSEFLKDTYSDKIATYYGDLDKIDYQGEKIIDDYASVRLLLTTKSKVEHPLEYRMQKSASGGDWKVYDVVIEGVSLVKNYRDQFDAIIAKSSYEGLIKEIKAKQPTAPQLP